MKCFATVSLWLMILGVTALPSVGALTFTPAPGFVATDVWSGADAAHFAMYGGNLYIYGSQQTGVDEYQNVVRVFDGASTTEVARSPVFGPDEYSADSITVANGEVYWGHTRGFTETTVYKSTQSGGGWSTVAAIDASRNVTVYSLSSNGDSVLGVAVDNDTGGNEAFFLNGSDEYQVFAAGLDDYSGGSGFDPLGNFYAGGVSGMDFSANMYRYSSQQVVDRLTGAQATPYSTADAVGVYAVPNNASAVMESDGLVIYGSDYNATFTGTNPYWYDLNDGTHGLLGELSGADTVVATDLYYWEGATYFLAKDSWATGAEARIYRVTPEPMTLVLLLCGLAVARRWR
jgi:hypothetical protein